MATAVAATEQGFASTRQHVDARVVEALDYSPMLRELRGAFDTGVTKSIEWRKKQLEALKQGVLDMHLELTAAVRADLGGPKLRGIGEIAVIDELTHALANIDEWVAPHPVSVACAVQWCSAACGCALVSPCLHVLAPPLLGQERLFANLDADIPLRQVKNSAVENPNGSAEIIPSPKGVVLLISPWNYPIGLCLKPLVVRRTFWRGCTQNKNIGLRAAFLRCCVA
jgi:aldehyde dehydrogenase (NAD+)